MGITTVLDLLQHYPRRYVDRTQRAEIAELSIGDEATVDAEVRSIHARRTRDRKRTIVNGVVYDGTGLLEVVFFNQPWRERQLRPGTQVSLFGKVESYRGKRQMTNPVVDVLAAPDDERDPDAGRAENTGAIVPVYPQSGKAEVHTWQLRARGRVGARAHPAARSRRSARRRAPPRARPRRPQRTRTRASTGPRRWPTPTPRCAGSSSTSSCACSSRSSPASARSRRTRRASATTSTARSSPSSTRRLPFPLTGDQERAIAEISRDLAGNAPMHRLLQGEVGSGKTVVALTALLTAVQGGYQGAFMAPTEVLAEQHELTMRALLDGLVVPSEGTLLAERPVRSALLTNRTPAAERRRIAEGLRTGDVDILVGTHALIYGGVEFARLGLAVIDEQHRFGVEQRDLLRAKGDSPDVLVMTATPIPRTAAMLIYGDLDKSELRELPAGRSPITTEVVGPGELERVAVYERVRTEVAAGRQAYVVCPLVEGSEKLEARRGHRGARAPPRRGARRAAHRPAARPDAVGRQGGGDGRVPGR